MAIPTYVGNGGEAFGTGDVTPALPTGWQENDIFLLQCEHSDATIGTISGWTKIVTEYNQFASGPSYQTWYWRRATASESNPTVPDPGNHLETVVHAFRGCITSGDPWDIQYSGNDTTGTSGVTVPGSTTTVDDCLVVMGVGQQNDTNNHTVTAGPTNADLGSPTSRFADGTNQGDGGCLALFTGEKAAAGSFGSTTATVSNNAGNKTYIVFALKPPAGGAQHFGAATLTATAGLTTAGKKDAHAASALPSTVAAAVTAKKNANASLAAASTVGIVTAGKKTAYAASALPLTAAVAAAGKKNANATTTVPVVLTFATAGVVSGGIEGAASLAVTFGTTTAGKKNANAALDFPTTLAAAAAGKKNANGSSSLPIVAGRTTSGKKTANAASSLAAAVTVSTAARRATFATTALPLTLDIVTSGQAGGTVTGAASLAATFGATTTGKRDAHAASALTAAVTVSTQAKAGRNAAATLTATLTASVAAVRNAYGALTLPITLGIDARGVVSSLTKNRAYPGSGRTSWAGGPTLTRGTAGSDHETPDVNPTTRASAGLGR